MRAMLGRVGLFTKSLYRECLSDLNVPAEISQAGCAPAIHCDDACRRALAWHCHNLIFHTDTLMGRGTIYTGGRATNMPGLPSRT